jgi:ribosomal protein S18 acetylase RimI-like enzyme
VTPYGIQPLRAEDVKRLGMGWFSAIPEEDIKRHVEAHPGLAWWSAATGNYILGDFWMKRRKIGHIVEYRREGEDLQALWYALAESFRSMGTLVVLMLVEGILPQESMWLRLGFQEWERLIYYSYRIKGTEGNPSTQLSFRKAGPEDLDGILIIDHAAYPWLWWNERRAFQEYLAQAGIEVYLVGQGGTEIGYFSYATFGFWAHLDRIALLPEFQGKRLAPEMLKYLIQLVRTKNIHEINLSTQERNWVSRRLYEGFGFRRETGMQTLYACWL